MPTLKSPPGRTWCFQTNLAPFFQEGFNQRLAEGNYLPGLLCQFETPMKKELTTNVAQADHHEPS